MPRFLVKLKSGASTADVEPMLASVQGVGDVTSSRSFGGFIVSGEASSKQEIANQPGVESVHEDIQAFPQTADEETTRNFAERVKEMRGADEVPPSVEADAVTGDKDVTRK